MKPAIIRLEIIDPIIHAYDLIFELSGILYVLRFSVREDPRKVYSQLNQWVKEKVINSLLSGLAKGLIMKEMLRIQKEYNDDK